MGRWIKKDGVLSQTLENLEQNKSLIRCCPNIYLPNNDNKDKMEINMYFIVLTCNTNWWGIFLFFFFNEFNRVCLVLGIGDGQGSLECCSPLGLKESDTTEWLSWTELMPCSLHCYNDFMLAFSIISIPIEVSIYKYSTNASWQILMNITRREGPKYSYYT